MTTIADLFRATGEAAREATTHLADYEQGVRSIADAAESAIRRVEGAAAGTGTDSGGGAGGEAGGASPAGGGPSLPTGFLGPGAPTSGGGTGGNSGGNRGGNLRIGAEAPSGAVSGGQSGASAAALSSGFLRVEGALSSGLNRLAAVPTAGERSISAAVAANAAAIGRLADVIGRSDGGAGFRARAGLGL